MFAFVIPEEIANKNGAVIIPVVAPPASKAIAIYSLLICVHNKKIIANIIRYKYLTLMFFIILKIANAISPPTPAPIKNTNTIFETETPAPLTWSEKIITSGSAMVAHIPNITAKTTKITNFEALLTEPTINSPIGIIVESTPDKNQTSPTLTKTMATINEIKTPVSNL